MKFNFLNYIFTVCLFLNPITAQAQIENNDNYIDKNICAENKIAEIRIYEHYEIEEEQKRLLFHLLFNKKGRCIESFFYQPYLPKVFPLVKGCMEPHHELFYYNESDSLIQSTGFINNFPVSRNYTYKNKDQFTIEKSDGNDIWDYTFDSLGKLTKKAWYMADGRLPVRVEMYEYDSIGRKIKTTAYNPDTSIFYYEIYEFDSASNLKLVKQYRENVLSVIWEYTYETGNLIGVNYRDLLEPKNSTWRKYTRNDKGLILKETGTLSGNKNVYEREYEYKYYN